MSGTGFVRPLHARLVRPDGVVAKVFPMFDALPALERTSQPGARGGPTRRISPEGYEEPSTGLYVYRLRRDEQEHVGLVGDVLVEAFVDGRVRGHEEVQPERVAALVELFSSDAYRSELVALLHAAGPAVEAALTASVATTPLLDFVGPEGWEQTVWRVPEEVARAALDEMGSAVHYVADGHHRVAASLQVWEQQGRPADAVVMSVIYPLEGLQLLAFHRRLVGPVVADTVLDLLSEEFEVTHVADPDDVGGCFALYVDNHWYDVRYDGVRPHGAAGLDVTILDEQVLRPLLGSESDSGRLEIASALTPIPELVKACDEDGGALFALRPPALEQLTEVADRGEVMPPKTTYFDPKPSAGIFLR